MGENVFRLLTERYPFITLCSYAGDEYLGIVQNQDADITTIYDFGALADRDEKQRFLDLAATWWWESNRSVPINIFLKQEWLPFHYCLRTFSNKDLSIIHGPVCSLNDIAKKKTKRRSIILVRKVDG